ncbi:unnamed protein product [Sphagnum balticum]
MNKKHSIGHELNKAFLTDTEFEQSEKYKKLRIENGYNNLAAVLPTIETPRGEIIDRDNHDYIFVARGFTCYLFNPKTMGFTRIADSLRDRSYFEAVAIKDTIFAIKHILLSCGGTVEFYNAQTKKWATAESLPRKLRSIGAACLTPEGTDRLLGGVHIGHGGHRFGHHAEERRSLRGCCDSVHRRRAGPDLAAQTREAE